MIKQKLQTKSRIIGLDIKLTDSIFEFVDASEAEAEEKIDVRISYGEKVVDLPYEEFLDRVFICINADKLSELEQKLVQTIRQIESIEGRKIKSLVATSEYREKVPDKLGSIEYELYENGEFTTQEDVRKWEASIQDTIKLRDTKEND